MSGLYVHIPFCHSKCAYCDFYSSPNSRLMSDLVEALVAEVDRRREEVDWTGSNTIYIGGGTPSILPLTLLNRLISSLPPAIALNTSEFTIEANPEDVTSDKVKAWCDMGINRVSMGVQSLNDAELKIIGRRHTAAEAIDAYENIISGGIDNVSLDLIYGLPLQTLESWQQSLQGVINMAPKHLSAYMLTYEPDTRLYGLRKSGKIAESDESTITQMYRILCQEAANAGYAHYEISNFAKPQYEAVHNSNYWNGTPYLGIGPSAHSYDGETRRINPANTKAYVEAISQGKNAFALDPEDEFNKINDMLITALRTAKGVKLEKLPQRHYRQLLKDAKSYIDNGALVLDNGFLRFTEASWLVSDAIMTDLVQLP